jgi:hypothetical protein
MDNRALLFKTRQEPVSQEFLLSVTIEHLPRSQLPFDNHSVTVRNEGDWPFSRNQNLTRATNVIA